MSPPTYTASPNAEQQAKADATLSLLIRDARRTIPAVRDFTRYELLCLGRAFIEARDADRAEERRRERETRAHVLEEFGGWLKSNWPSLALATFGATRRPAVDPHRWREHT
jgi:hypothetical protein